MSRVTTRACLWCEGKIFIPHVAGLDNIKRRSNTGNVDRPAGAALLRVLDVPLN